MQADTPVATDMSLAQFDALAGDVVDLFWISPQPVGLNDALIDGVRMPHGWTAHHVMGHSNRVDFSMVSVSDEAIAAIRAGELVGAAWGPARMLHFSAPRGRVTFGQFRGYTLSRAAIRSGAFTPYNGTMLGIWVEQRARGMLPALAICEDTPHGAGRALARCLAGDSPAVMMTTGGQYGTIATVCRISGETAFRWELQRKGLAPLLDSYQRGAA